MKVSIYSSLLFNEDIDKFFKLMEENKPDQGSFDLGFLVEEELTEEKFKELRDKQTELLWVEYEKRKKVV